MNYTNIFKFCFLILFLTFNIAFSQENKTLSISNVKSDAPYIYYIDVKGVDTKEICKNIENVISSKNDVISFRTVGFPSKYFILKSSKHISPPELKGWLTNNNLNLGFYGQSESSLEQLIANKRK